jgi:hypothetical protein
VVLKAATGNVHAAVDGVRQTHVGHENLPGLDEVDDDLVEGIRCLATDVRGCVVGLVPAAASIVATLHVAERVLLV